MNAPFNLFAWRSTPVRRVGDLLPRGRGLHSPRMAGPVIRRWVVVGRVALAGVVLAGGVAGGGCASTGIAVREKLGIPKREQLVDRVKEARDGQQAAKKQFESALAEFMSVTGATGGDLETRYKALCREYDRSVERSDEVKDRIKSVERVSDALFREWKQELGTYSPSAQDLRRESERMLNETRAQYEKMHEAMKAAEAKMGPVLTALNDHKIFLKHNLNARAVASLQGTTAAIQGDVQRLIDDMNASIAEANAFIAQLGTEAGK